MIGLLVALILLSWLFGRARGLIGGLAGGFVGAFVVAGMTAATSNGELAALYSPGRLASTAVPVAIVAAVLALVAPYAIGFAAAAWAIGAILAAMTAPGADQAVYVLPLAAHGVAAGAIVFIARWRAGRVPPSGGSEGVTLSDLPAGYAAGRAVRWLSFTSLVWSSSRRSWSCAMECSEK